MLVRLPLDPAGGPLDRAAMLRSGRVGTSKGPFTIELAAEKLARRVVGVWVPRLGHDAKFPLNRLHIDWDSGGAYAAVTHTGAVAEVIRLSSRDGARVMGEVSAAWLAVRGGVLNGSKPPPAP